MRTKSVTIPVVASALALSLALTGPAMTQTTSPSGTPSTPPPASTTDKAPPATTTDKAPPATTTDRPPVASTVDNKTGVPEGAVARANAVIGTSVRNSAGEKIGTVDDLLLGSDSKVNYAVLSVGGFLGIGDRLVAVPMSDLQMAGDHMVMPSATKDSVSKLPKFDRSAVYYPGYVKDVPKTSPGTTTTPSGTPRQ